MRSAAYLRCRLLCVGAAKRCDKQSFIVWRYNVQLPLRGGSSGPLRGRALQQGAATRLVPPLRGMYRVVQALYRVVRATRVLLPGSNREYTFETRGSEVASMLVCTAKCNYARECE